MRFKILNIFCDAYGHFYFLLGQSDGAGGRVVSHAGSERSAEETHRRRPEWSDEGPQRVQHHCGKWGDQAGELDQRDRRGLIQRESKQMFR